MKRILLFAASMVTYAATTNARLGETLPQCEKRYGAITVQNGDTYTFKKSGVIITATIMSGSVQAITFEHTDGTELINEEVNQLFLANGGGHPWLTTNDEGSSKFFRTDDYQRIAKVPTDRKQVAFFSEAYVDYLTSKRIPRHSLKGF